MMLLCIQKRMPRWLKDGWDALITLCVLKIWRKSIDVEEDPGLHVCLDVEHCVVAGRVAGRSMGAPAKMTDL